jgi:lipoprotein-anchoring transpeptidase ErfK/SrfK
LKDVATPTQAEFHAYVEIAKPTNTNIPTEIPTSTAEPTANADMVVDMFTPEYAASVIEQPFDQSNSAGTNYNGNKHILIDISEQHMYVYEGDTLVYSFVSSTGMNNATSVGSFSVLNKIPNAYGATWNIWMPNWLGIYWAGSLQNGIHALPILPNGAQLWEGYLGTPISYGCIVLGADEALLLYDWAEIGTPVEIQW